eukprot:Skav217097  [mRNA]  locus=scaffold187:161191:164601:- [translate_table: standard]
MTPGGSASHLMLAIPCASTACRTPGYICPSYSTFTRPPSRKEDEARETCRASRVGHAATRIPCVESLCDSKTEGSAAPEAASSPAMRSQPRK